MQQSNNRDLAQWGSRTLAEHDITGPSNGLRLLALCAVQQLSGASAAACPAHEALQDMSTCLCRVEAGAGVAESQQALLVEPGSPCCLLQLTVQHDVQLRTYTDGPEPSWLLAGRKLAQWWPWGGGGGYNNGYDNGYNGGYGGSNNNNNNSAALLLSAV